MVLPIKMWSFTPHSSEYELLSSATMWMKLKKVKEKEAKEYIPYDHTIKIQKQAKLIHSLKVG